MRDAHIQEGRPKMRHALPLIWRKSLERYRLIGCSCENCGTDYFPPRKVCPKCRRKGKIAPKQMPTEGKVYSYSLVHAAPSGFEFEAPYHVAIVELANGVRLLTQIVDSDAAKVKIGAPVKMVFRKIFEDDCEGVIAYGYKFKAV